MKIYVPTQAIINSLYIAVDNCSRKPYLVFYIKASDSVPFICDDYLFFFKEIDRVENYTFYPFTTDIFHRLLAYIKDEKGSRENRVSVGLNQLLRDFSRLLDKTNFHSISYKDLGNNQTKYQKAFWYVISNSFAPKYMWFDIGDFLKDFLFSLSNNSNITEYIYEVEEIKKPFLFKANPVLHNVGWLERLKHYISHCELYFIIAPPLIILIVIIISEVL
mgnify:CR=1 FL=1